MARALQLRPAPAARPSQAQPARPLQAKRSPAGARPEVVQRAAEAVPVPTPAPIQAPAAAAAAAPAAAAPAAAAAAAPADRSVIALPGGAPGGQSQAAYVGAWQTASIDSAINFIHANVVDKALFTERITPAQRQVFLKNYQDVVMNALDQALKRHLTQNVALGLNLGARIVKTRAGGGSTVVAIQIWDDGGGFPATMLGEQGRKDFVEQKSAKAGLHLGGKGIGLQRLVNESLAAGGRVVLDNTATGARVSIAFPYLADE